MVFYLRKTPLIQSGWSHFIASNVRGDHAKLRAGKLEMENIRMDP